MKKLVIGAAIAVVGIVAAPARAQTHNAQIQGFGGLTVQGISTAPVMGGSLAVPLTDNIQIIGEGGRLRNVMSSTLATLIDFTPVDLRLTALYGQGGIRFIGSSDRAVRPYAEATAGMARLRTGFSGIGERTDAGINTALRFLDRTAPVLGVGAGVIVQGGPVFVDLGYRYQQFRNSNALQAVLSGGDLAVSQVRVGVGVRF